MTSCQSHKIILANIFLSHSINFRTCRRTDCNDLSYCVESPKTEKKTINHKTHADIKQFDYFIMYYSMCNTILISIWTWPDDDNLRPNVFFSLSLSSALGNQLMRTNLTWLKPNMILSVQQSTNWESIECLHYPLHSNQTKMKWNEKTKKIYIKRKKKLVQCRAKWITVRARVFNGWKR